MNRSIDARSDLSRANLTLADPYSWMIFTRSFGSSRTIIGRPGREHVCTRKNLAYPPKWRRYVTSRMIVPLTTALKPIQTISILFLLKKPSIENATWTRK